MHFSTRNASIAQDFHQIPFSPSSAWWFLPKSLHGWCCVAPRTPKTDASRKKFLQAMDAAVGLLDHGPTMLTRAGLVAASGLHLEWIRSYVGNDNDEILATTINHILQIFDTPFAHATILANPTPQEMGLATRKVLNVLLPKQHTHAMLWAIHLAPLPQRRPVERWVADAFEPYAGGTWLGHGIVGVITGKVEMQPPVKREVIRDVIDKMTVAVLLFWKAHGNPNNHMA